MELPDHESLGFGSPPQPFASHPLPYHSPLLDGASKRGALFLSTPPLPQERDAESQEEHAKDQYHLPGDDVEVRLCGDGLVKSRGIGAVAKAVSYTHLRAHET